MKPLLFLVTALWNTGIIGASAEDANVRARVPIVILARRFDLPRLCGTPVKVDACTAFVGQRLTCVCEARDGGWRITAHAQFIPVMYVLGADRVGHERDHIGDIETALSSYLQTLQRRQFATSSDCEDVAANEMSRFTQIMDNFKRESNAKRHPRY